MIFVLWAIMITPFAYNFVYPFSSGETKCGELRRKRYAVYGGVFINAVFTIANIILELNK